MSANPLFEQWLEEWHEKEMERNTNYQYCFAKALKILKKCPVPLYSAAECSVLRYFGSFITTRIERKLTKYRRTQDDEATIDGTVSSTTVPCSSSITQIDSRIPLDILKPNKCPARIRQLKRTLPNEILKVKRRNNTQNEIRANNAKVRSPRKTRQYSPEVRSGAYAILLTMLKEKQKLSYPGFMFKSEIIEKAANLCDSSFTHPEPGSRSRYTAWAGMATLCKKGLVSSWSSPKMFNLTIAGEELAQKLLQNTHSGNHGNQSAQFLSPAIKRVPSSSSASVNTLRRNMYEEDDEDSDTVDDPGIPVPSSSRSNNVSSSRSILQDSFDEDTSTVNHSGVFFRSPSAESCNVSSSIWSSLQDTFDADMDDTVSRFQSPVGSSTPSLFSTNKLNASYISSNGEDAQMTNYVTKPILSASSSETYCHSNTVNDCDEFSNCTPSTVEPLIFEPEDYKIILLVDKRETQIRDSISSTSETAQELKNFGIIFEERVLNVGDFVWVARNNNNQELLLPYIVERKRLDDLASSKTDGRYREQKSRLNRCGLQNVIYLVERFRNDAQSGLPLATLYQDIVDTQLIDGFFVKTTNNHKQSMLYLSVLTKCFINMFRDKILAGCALKNLTPFDMKTATDVISLPTFQEFSQVSVKKKKTNIRVQDMFVRHMSLMAGLSLEKASLIAQEYHTPLLLKLAFDSSNNPEALLQDIIGPDFSRIIFQLYCKRTLS